MACGSLALISSTDAVCGITSEYTCASRTRRAISCAYCAPKSTTSTACSVTSGRVLVPHADALRALQVLALGLQRGSDHDFGLLELLDGLVAAGGHRGAQRPEQVHASVVLVRGA